MVDGRPRRSIPKPSLLSISPECVCTFGDIGVIGNPFRLGIIPILIETFEHVCVLDVFGIDKVERSKFDRKEILFLAQHKLLTVVDPYTDGRFSVNGNLFIEQLQVKERQIRGELVRLYVFGEKAQYPAGIAQ